MSFQKFYNAQPNGALAVQCFSFQPSTSLHQVSSVSLNLPAKHGRATFCPITLGPHNHVEEAEEMDSSPH